MPKYPFKLLSEEEMQQDSQPLVNIPDGDYEMEIIESRIKVSRAGGDYILLVYKILSPNEYLNSVIFDRFMTSCESDKAIYIAKKRLTNLCIALRIKEKFDNTEQLHGKRFIGCLKNNNSVYGPSITSYNACPLSIKPLSGEQQKSAISDESNDDLTF